MKKVEKKAVKKQKKTREQKRKSLKDKKSKETKEEIIVEKMLPNNTCYAAGAVAKSYNK